MVSFPPALFHLCVNPKDWKWASAWAHLKGYDNKLVRVQPMLDRIDDWCVYLSDTGNEFTKN